ncbi:nonselective cation channel [Colletotrichum asianum]
MASSLSLMSIASLDRPLKLSALAFHLFGRTLEGIEAFDKDVRKDQKADFPRMIFMVSAQYAACNQLAECSTRYVDSLVGCTCMLPQELDAIRQ